LNSRLLKKKRVVLGADGKGQGLREHANRPKKRVEREAFQEKIPHGRDKTVGREEAVRGARNRAGCGCSKEKTKSPTLGRIATGEEAGRGWRWTKEA